MLFISSKQLIIVNQQKQKLFMKHQNSLLIYKKMIQEDYIYFAQELQQITPRSIPTSFGNIHSITAGIPGQPLILVVHGSGPKNSSDVYAYLLQQYLVRISYLEKFYIVAIDCPGYGKSKGSKEAVKTFPLQMFKEILQALNYKTYFAMFGHSQGGAAIFNAVHEDPTITQFLIMERPVCGNIQRFRKFSLPTLLIYDIEDDGHPIWQGKLLYKELLNTQFYTFRSSQHPYWVPDNIWDKMLNFFSRQTKRERKSHFMFEGERKNKSCSRPKSHSKGKDKTKKNMSVDRMTQIKKNQVKGIELLKIQELQRSELMSVQSKRQSDEQSLQEKPEKKRREDSQISEEEILRMKEEEEQRKRFLMPPRIIQMRMQPHPELKMQQNTQQIQQTPQQDALVQKILPKAPVNKEALQQNNKCVICYELLYRPVSTNCNHTFCSKCLIESLLINQKCPLCRTKITKKTQNKELQQRLLKQLSEKQLERRQKDFNAIEKMMKSIVYIEIGNTSRALETKQSAFTKTKKKYIWELFVKQPKHNLIEEVSFNINMGQRTAKPIRIRNAPFTFESRGTFSFGCEVSIKLKNKDYPELVSIYRIDIEPGYHSKKVALKKKCYTK